MCIGAGLLGGFGITMLYRGLAIGRMGIVAAVTGVLAAVIPVIAGFVTQGIPPPLVVVGSCSLSWRSWSCLAWPKRAAAETG